MNQAEPLKLPLKFEIQDVLPNYIGPLSPCWLETNHPASFYPYIRKQLLFIFISNIGRQAFRRVNDNWVQT